MVRSSNNAGFNFAGLVVNLVLVAGVFGGIAASMSSLV